MALQLSSYRYIYIYTIQYKHCKCLVLNKLYCIVYMYNTLKKIVTSIFLLKVNVVFSTLLKRQLTSMVNCPFNRVLKTTLTFNKNIEVTIFFRTTGEGGDVSE